MLSLVIVSIPTQSTTEVLIPFSLPVWSLIPFEESQEFFQLKEVLRQLRLSQYA